MATSPISEHVALAGSDRKLMRGSVVTGEPNAEERIRVSVLLRHRDSKTLPSAHEMGSRYPHERTYLSREELQREYGADSNDIARVAAFAAAHDLAVVESSAARRMVVLEGTIQALSSAFQVQLMQYDSPRGPYRGRSGPVSIPSDLQSIVIGVFGLDNRPVFHRRTARPALDQPMGPEGSTSFPIPELAALYDFPTGSKGHGQTIGIIEFGGGFSTLLDLDPFFAGLGLSTPAINIVSVDGVGNAPFDDGSDEVTLDIEVAGAIAPGARIAMFFAPNSEQGGIDAITTAIHDDVRDPSVISISWGASESEYSQQTMTAMDEAFAEAALMGITICAASGDDGSKDEEDDGDNHVNFPASAPHALGCGGTILNGSGSTITSEVVWNDTLGKSGGGISSFFTVPPWQLMTAGEFPFLPMRGVPDVAAHAAGCAVRFFGLSKSFGGTSAVAPLWAGLIALLNDELGHRVGFLNPLLYQHLGPGVVRDITKGNNGAFHATAGWDACTGLGSPRGRKLLSALRKVKIDTAFFTPPGSPIENLTPKVYFFVGDEYLRYDVVADAVDSGYPNEIEFQWTGVFKRNIGAAIFTPTPIHNSDGRPKVYFFKGSEFIRYDVLKAKADDGYPMDIKPHWPGVFENGIDTAFFTPSPMHSNEKRPKIYFFKGGKYVRFDVTDNKVDDGYPKDIQPNWPGVFAKDIDAVILTPAGVPDNQPGPKLYFFKGAQYIRFDVAGFQVDGGYPKDIASEWHGLW